MRSRVRTFALALTLLFACVNTVSAQTPSSSEGQVQQIELEGVPLAFSPDGQWIAGVTGTAQVCVWDVASLTPTCDGDFEIPISHHSLVWSPDSSAVAFSLESGQYLKDSDIYIFEVDSGTIVNLTDDDPDNTGADEISLLETSDIGVPIDLFPAWSPDSQNLIFARTIWEDTPVLTTTLMTISRDGGEPEERLTLDAPGPMLVYSPMKWLEDDSILFSIWMSDVGDPANGIWQLSPSGEATQVISGHPEAGIPTPVLVDISSDGTAASGYSHSALQQYAFTPGVVWFDMDLENGTFSSWEDILGLPTDQTDAYATDGPGILIAPPIYNPADDSVIFMTRVGGQTVHLSVAHADGSITGILEIGDDWGTLGGNKVGPRIFLASDGSLLVISPNGVVLIPPPKAP